MMTREWFLVGSSKDGTGALNEVSSFKARRDPRHEHILETVSSHEDRGIGSWCKSLRVAKLE